jgi:hypothetical protein
MFNFKIKKIRKDILCLFLILGIAAVLLMRQIGNPAIVTGDSSHHLMDGIFVLDFLRDMPIFGIYDYTVNYYIQYPALGIGYRPPFFPLTEAIFNGIFCVHVWSSRLAILAFFFIGTAAWFKLVDRIFDTGTAFWTTLMLVTTPFIVKWGWYTMAELPVLSMAMLTVYVFYRYTESQQPRHLYIAAVLFGATAWTKQTAVFLALWFLLYLIIKGDFWSYLKRREVWIAMLISIIIIMPLASITLWLGSFNIHQSFGYGAGVNPFSRISVDNLLAYWKLLATNQLTPPVLVISVVGIIWAAFRRDRKALYFAVGIISTYAFFSYLVAKTERYTIFWIPAFSLFAALPLYYLRQSKRKYCVGAVLMAILILYQVSQVYTRTPDYVTGYDDAARYVLKHSKSKTVFFDGHVEALFVYFMRALDPNRSMYVLRGHKTLSTSVFNEPYGLKAHANTPRDIRDIFDRFGIEYILVERKKSKSAAGIHQVLRDFLQEGSFEMVKEIPVLGSRKGIKEQTIRIYRYLDPKPITADYIEIRLPAVGQTIKGSIRHLKSNPIDP